MTLDQVQPHDGQGRRWSRPYVRALASVLAAWLLGLLGAVSLNGLFRFVSTADLMWVACGSGLIAFLAMVPGWMGARGQRSAERRSADPSAHAQRLMFSLLSGTAIRFTGTVALFLTCRYHMATPTELIAGMTIGWYVLLTSIEVYVLARELPNTVQAPFLPETSLG